MDENVEDGQQTQADVAIVNRHVRMLRLKASHQLQAFVEKALGIFLVEVQMLLVPVVLIGEEKRVRMSAVGEKERRTLKNGDGGIVDRVYQWMCYWGSVGGDL